MLLACRRRVIVADGSKVGEVELAKVCDIGEVTTLITDESADGEIVETIAIPMHANLTDAEVTRVGDSPKNLHRCEHKRAGEGWQLALIGALRR